MSDPYLGEIRMFAGSFAPQGWALCDGQVLPIQQYTTLFSLLGTTYGGDGRNTFALPNLRDRAPLHYGQAPSLSPYDLGEESGTPVVFLNLSQLAAHSHAGGCAIPGTNQQNSPADAVWTTTGRGKTQFYSSTGTPTPMNKVALLTTGGGQPHPNRQPYLVINFIIALQGEFPPRG